MPVRETADVVRTGAVAAADAGGETTASPVPLPPPPGAPAPHGRIRLGAFVFVLGQLALVALVLRQFGIESYAFLRVALLAFGGFALHAWLPMALRLPFFVLLSVASVALVFGVAGTLWLVGLGGSLIVLCHLPLPFRFRVALVLAAGGLLATVRMEWLSAPWSAAVWPVLASMFMFRLIVYLYDLKHDAAPVLGWRTFAYFFMLPNVCFPLFPVVDWKGFRRTYYDADAYQIYQRGVEWIVRGVLHLVLYRAVYYYFTLAPSEITSPTDLGRFMLANFLLYLRISGQFHLIVGMLHLFGFHLPETHHRYYLASSFTDFWRRINIYWKDFMLKVFYFPAYFWLRQWGTTTALVLATLFVFFATWLLHAYQWFWLRGTVLLSGPDVGFWTILAVLVVGNSLWENRHGRARALARPVWTWRAAVGRGLGTLGTFVVICVLWSFWTAESVSAWLSLWRVFGEGTVRPTAWILPLVVAAAVVTDGVAARPPASVPPPTAARLRGRRRTLLTLGWLLALSLAGFQDVYARLGTGAANVLHSLRMSQLSRADSALLERGYYEDLLRVDRFNSQLWEVYMRRPADWLDVTTSGINRLTGDFLLKELVPSAVTQTSFGPLRINRWGMRDREYAPVPPPGTHRMALLGNSTVMGWGVAEDEDFESLVESRLNREPPAGAWERYEVVNFAVFAYRPTQQLVMLDRALAFRPQVVVYVVTGKELSTATKHLAEIVPQGVAVPYDFLRDVLRRAGVSPGTAQADAERRLAPYNAEVLGQVYRYIADTSRAQGAVPLMVMLPFHGESKTWRSEREVVRRLAEAAEFLVLDLNDVFDGHPPSAVRLADWDLHPNAFAHRLIADRLDRELRAHAAQLGLTAAPAPTARRAGGR